MSNKQLRPYQRTAIHDIYNAWREGNRSVLFQMPTGTGKTVLFAAIVQQGYLQSRKILIVVHRRELVRQIEKELVSRDVELNKIVAGQKTDYSKIIHVASIQTLNNREHPDADLVIIDEAHHAKAESYKKLWEIYPTTTKILGVTATPTRLSGEGFDDLFEVLVQTQPVRKFIDQGFLVPIKQLVGAIPNLKGVKQNQGDYITKALSDVMLDNTLMADLVDAYIKHTPDKSMIVFAVDVEHSKAIAVRYNEAGIVAAHIDATTPDKQREDIIQNFVSGKIKVICNVEIITEGFDFPECEVVQLARPTKSLSLYLQMVGRVMRIAKNKTEGIVLDNAGLWLEHSLAIVDREWSLEASKIKGVRKFDEVARDEEGIVKEVNRNKPNEVKGLELIPLTTEYENLLKFESFLAEAISRKFKLIQCYYKFQTWLSEWDHSITKIEFEYIERRLKKLNETVPAEKRFGKGVFYHEKRKYNLV